MHDAHLAALEMRIVPLNWSGRLEVLTALDGRVLNAGVDRYKSLDGRHLVPVHEEATGYDTLLLEVRTKQSRFHVAMAARTRVYGSAGEPHVEGKAYFEPGLAARRFEVESEQGKPIRLEKVVSLHTSRDQAITECCRAARDRAADAPRFEPILGSHRLRWKRLWHHFGIEIEQEDGQEAETVMGALRLHIFHLLQTTSLHTVDLDAGVPARGWHGEAYRGHIFWDELFIFPLFNLRVPSITRALLLYRHRRLEAARRAAELAGYQGAMYPWQSGSDGREETQKIHLNPKSGRWLPDHSHLQRHVNIAIAYNVWRYFQATRDFEFLSYQGAEMVLEIARFWAGVATYNPSLQRYEILGVMGPDEYHDAYPGADRPGLDNNAYTNLMAVWVLAFALDLGNILSAGRYEELLDELGIGREELHRWDEISRKMRIVFHGGGIISQFEGYADLEEFDWERCRKKYGDIHRLDRILEAEGDTPNRYKVSKQADVLMLFFLLSADELTTLFRRIGVDFDPESIPKNIEYYIRRTSHGSTLSYIVHSWVLARSGRSESWPLFRRALMSDIGDIQGGTTREGIHLGAMAGTVDLMQRGYAGIEKHGNVLCLNPCLPDPIRALRMEVRYRGHALRLEITHEEIRVDADFSSARPIRIGIHGKVYDLKEGEALQVRL